ncbi:MAG: hypothetical protein ACLR52_00840 [Veillonella atypica]
MQKLMKDTFIAGKLRCHRPLTMDLINWDPNAYNVERAKELLNGKVM